MVKAIDWVGMQRDCVPAGKNWQITAPVLLRVVLLLYSTAITAQMLPGHVAAGLHKCAVLSPRLSTKDRIQRIEWRKHKGGTKILLMHDVPKNNTTYFPTCAECDVHNLSLILKNVQKGDGGVYEISLIFENSTVINQEVNLTIISPPQIKVFLGNVTRSVLTLQCELGEGDWLSAEWLHNGEPLPWNERYSLSEGNSTLLVNNITVKDCGNYSCVATRDTFRTEAHVQLPGELVDVCSEQRQTFSPVYISVLAASIAVLLCVILICCIKHTGHQRELQTKEDNEEDHVYDEIKETKVELVPSGSCSSVPRQTSLNRQSAGQQNEAVYSCITIENMQMKGLTDAPSR